MGTRSMIGRYNEDGTVTAVYCHWDGYLEHNGQILAEHYTDDDKIQDLIGLGAMSALGAELGEKHNFAENTGHDWCTFYARDRGEKIGVERFEDPEAFRKDGYARSGAEFLYLWDREGWFVASYDQPKWDDLTEALKDVAA